MMVVTASAAASVIAVMRYRTGRNNSRNRVLIDHLADRVFQQDHELIERLNLPLQLRNGSCKDCPLAILSFPYMLVLYLEPCDSEKLRTIRLNCTHSVSDITNNLNHFV